MHGTLTIVMPDGRTQTVRLDRRQLRIGRNPDNDVVLDDPSVSGYHARVFAGPAGLSILDVGSSNGTEVDGRLIAAQTPIGATSTIRIGTATVRVTLPTASAGGDDFVLPPFPDPTPPPVVAAVAATAATGAAPTRAEGPPLVRLDMQPPRAKADIAAGGPAVLTFVATVQNLSRFVDRLDLSVDGPPWLAAVVDPPYHNLKPGDTAQSRVELSVPRSHEAGAGELQIDLVARSQKRPELRFAAATVLQVAPFTDFRFELLEPRHRTAWTGGKFRAQVFNGSNRPVVYNFEGLDTEGALTFRYEPDPVELKPGERRESELRARFKLFRLLGRARTYDFQATCEPIDQSAPLQQAQGRLIQRPPLPPWMLVSGVVIGLLALLLSCSSLLVRNRDRIAELYRGFFALPSPTVVLALTPEATPDAAGTSAALEAAFAQTQEAANAALAASAQAAQQAGGATQEAQASAAAATQAALGTAGAATQTAAAIQVTGTAGAQGTQAAGTATAFVTQVAGTATAQANATGTVIVGTQTSQAASPTPPALPPSSTPTATVPGPTIGQTITFDRLRGLSVNQRVPVRGDEYAAQDAFFCFYAPTSLLGGAGKPLFSMLRQESALTLSIADVSLNEGSTGGSTNFVFEVVGSFNNTSGEVERVFVLEYRTSDGGAPGFAAATSPSDYLPQAGNFALRFPPGEASARATLTIAVSADLEAEPDESFTVSVSSPEGVPLLGRTQAFGIILNDDLPSPTPTDTATPPPSATPDPFPAPPPSGDVFNCQPPVPAGQALIPLRGVIYPPPVVAANNGPFHSLTTDTDDGRLIPNAIAVVNFQRNVAEANVDIWYPGGEAAAYVMFAFDERQQAQVDRYAAA
ncbi:MAG TPA: FHA domain-containing protein, partial [Chloroflexaceae bacterium]|nr:FHA domain-containing protein [Chloroflexaceae bacterium]